MARTSFTSPRQPDSPSRQLILDLAKDLEQVRIHSFERKRVKAYERKSFYEDLDRKDREYEKKHNLALDAAAAKHDTLRREAEETLQTHLRAVEEEQRRQEEVEYIKIQRLKHEKAEKDKRNREEAAKVEAERRVRVEAEKQKAEEVKQAQKAAAESKRKDEERSTLEKKRREEDAQRAKEEEAQRKAETTNKEAIRTKAFGYNHRTPEEVEEHERYVQLHRHLKEFRKFMDEQAKLNPILKQNMGDMRRTIKKCAGQLLLDDKKANRKPVCLLVFFYSCIFADVTMQCIEVVDILRVSLTFQEPSVDIRQFIAFPPQQIASSGNANVPALFVYLFNMLSKAIVSQLVAEAGVTPRSAEPLGVWAAQIYSTDDLIYNGCTMIDMLLAKFHVVCPILWGFYGDENTVTGKDSIGWWREERPNGPFIPQQIHEERMIGLSSGFAALSLRNFTKTHRKNPLPNTAFWAALAHVLNVPPNEVQETHLYVLSSLLRYSVPRIVGFWADAGLAILRRAIVDFPASLANKTAGRATVELLRLILADEVGIIL